MQNDVEGKLPSPSNFVVISQVPNAAEFSQQLINCNVVSVTQMCLLVLSQMVARKKGLILNVSSASAVLPTPLMTMYSSTKVKCYSHIKH